MAIPQDESYILATYQISRATDDLAKRAKNIAIGLTVGSWTELPAAKRDEAKAHCGIVADIQTTNRHEDGSVDAEMTIGYPAINFVPSIASILTTVFGKLSMDGAIRLTGLTLPKSIIQLFPGPKFGSQGIRKKFGILDRPLLMSIFKSCIGFNLSELTAAFSAQARGLVDIVKDDEIFFTERYATPEGRVVAYKRAAHEVADKTGKLTRYAVHLTGSAHLLVDRAKKLAELGADALLFNVFTYGFDTLVSLAADPDINVPILAHPAFAGAMYASPNHGVHPAILLGQLTRLAGADLVLFPSPFGSVTLPEADSEQLVRALREPSTLKTPLPVPSAGIHPGLVPQLIELYGHDVVINAGGGIHGHPLGTEAGGSAFHAAIEAVLSGESLENAAHSSRELYVALERWGNPR